ncbi:MAG: alpha/beta hydrolase [Bacteroidota bacterium]
MRKITILLLAIHFLSCSSTAKKENPIIRNGNVEIAYISAGEGDTTLLFIHGWAINKEFWQKQVDQFSKRYHVVAVDLGGHGQSGKNRNSWTIPDYANDVISVINGLQLKKVVLIGHSMSGDVMLEVLKNQPQPVIGIIGIDNLTDISTSPLTPEQQKPIDDWFLTLEQNFDSVATDYCHAALFPPNYHDTASVNRVVKTVLQTDSLVAIATLKSIMNFSPNEAGLLLNSNLRLNLIVSSGNKVNDSVLTKYCKSGYAVKTIQGTGHYPMIEKPDEFNKALQETLEHL